MAVCSRRLVWGGAVCVRAVTKPSSGIHNLLQMTELHLHSVWLLGMVLVTKPSTKSFPPRAVTFLSAIPGPLNRQDMSRPLGFDLPLLEPLSNLIGTQ